MIKIKRKFEVILLVYILLQISGINNNIFGQTEKDLKKLKEDIGEQELILKKEPNPKIQKSIEAYSAFLLLYFNGEVNTIKAYKVSKVLYNIFGHAKFNKKKQKLIPQANECPEYWSLENNSYCLSTKIIDQKNVMTWLILKDKSLRDALDILEPNQIHGCVNDVAYELALTLYFRTNGVPDLPVAINLVKKNKLLCSSVTTPKFKIPSYENPHNRNENNTSVFNERVPHIRLTSSQMMNRNLEPDFSTALIEKIKLTKAKDVFSTISSSVNPNLTRELANNEIDKLIKDYGEDKPQVGIYKYGLMLFEDALSFGQYDIIQMLTEGFQELSPSVSSFLERRLVNFNEGFELDNFILNPQSNYSDISEDFMSFFKLDDNSISGNLLINRIAMSMEFGESNSTYSNRNKFMLYQQSELNTNWVRSRHTLRNEMRRIISDKMGQLANGFVPDDEKNLDWIEVRHNNGDISLVSKYENGSIVETYTNEDLQDFKATNNLSPDRDWGFYGPGFSVEEVADDISDYGDYIEGTGFFGQSPKSAKIGYSLDNGSEALDREKEGEYESSESNQDNSESENSTDADESSNSDTDNDSKEDNEESNHNDDSGNNDDSDDNDDSDEDSNQDSPNDDNADSNDSDGDVEKTDAKNETEKPTTRPVNPAYEDDQSYRLPISELIKKWQIKINSLINFKESDGSSYISTEILLFEMELYYSSLVYPVNPNIVDEQSSSGSSFDSSWWTDPARDFEKVKN